MSDFGKLFSQVFAVSARESNEHKSDLMNRIGRHSSLLSGSDPDDDINALHNKVFGGSPLSSPITKEPPEKCEITKNAAPRTSVANVEKNGICKSKKKTRGGNNLELASLYEMFPDVQKDIVKKCAIEKDFDIDKILEQLEDNSEELYYKAIGNEKDLYIYINYSELPNKINMGWRSELFANRSPDEEGDVEELGRKVEELKRRKQEYFSKTRQNAGAKNATICGHYSLKTREVNNEMEQLLHRIDRINLWNNKDVDKIDLHDMNPVRAIHVTVDKINFSREKRPTLRKLEVVTGYGKTTGKRDQKLKQRLMRFLEGKNIPFKLIPENPGVIFIKLWKIADIIEYP